MIDGYRKKFIAIGLAAGFAGVIVGFILGLDAGKDMCVNLAKEFVEIDQDKLRNLLEIYNKYAWRIK